jgi:hypothetical protein
MVIFSFRSRAIIHELLQDLFAHPIKHLNSRHSGERRNPEQIRLDAGSSPA